MVRLLLDQKQLVIELSAIERRVAMRRTSLTIPRTSIERVNLTDDPWTWLRGVRRPGTHIPGQIAAGTWQRTAGRDFVMLRRRHHVGVVITRAPGEEFQRVILSTSHAYALVDALQHDDVEVQANVTDIADQT